MLNQINKIKNIKKYGLLLIAFFAFQLSYSQENYISGYVIKNNNDTIKGFVDYRNWVVNPNEIQFKAKIENNPVLFKPTDIIEFGVLDEIYVSGIVDVEVSPSQINMLTKSPELDLKEYTTFLQTLFRGEKSLYFHKESDGIENFYIRNDQDFELLQYKRYLKERDGKTIAVEYQRYLGQLNQYLKDCEKIYSKLEGVTYKQSSLIKLFEYYYKCSPSKTSFQREEEKVVVDVGAMAGVSITSLKFKSNVFDYLTKAEFNSSSNFTAGLFVNIVLPRKQGKWSFYNELLYTSFKVDYKYEDITHENFFTITTTNFDYSYLKLNNLIRFKYPMDNLFWFFNGGLSSGFIISETNFKKAYTKFYAEETTIEGLALDDSRKYEVGFVIGTGLKFDKFSSELRLEKGNGMSNFSALSSSTTRFYFLLGYQF